MKKQTILCLALAAVFAFSTVGTTLAAWNAVNTSDHVVSTAAVTGKIIEKYDGAEGIYPGNTTEKVVNVQNTGSADSVVRVKVEKSWGETRDEDGNLQVNDKLSTDNLLIDYNTEYWIYDENDGYFYYKGVLAPGETTVEPLFKEFTVDKTTGSEYSGMTADIIVKMECVQAAYHGLSVWNKTFADLDVTYQDAEKPSMITKVSFDNPTDGFSFTPTDAATYTVAVQDLFYNFKNLLPGETVSQTIEITNNYSEAAEIFLCANNIAQSLSPDKVELVNKLLREYATIVVTDSTGTVIYNGPVWGNLDTEGTNPDTMFDNISLGKFTAGEMKGLNVQLQIDPDMGNEYAGLLGLVRWVWSANGIEEPFTPTPTPTPTPPKTGDNNSLVIFASMMAASGAALVIILVTGKKKKKAVQE